MARLAKSSAGVAGRYEEEYKTDTSNERSVKKQKCLIGISQKKRACDAKRVKHQSDE